MGLTLTDQCFLHQMTCSKALSETKTVELYNSCLAKAKGSRAIKVRDIEAVRHRINKMNDTLSPLGFQFKTIYSPWEKTVFWGFCNTLEDSPVPFASLLKKNENIAFFDLIEVLQDQDGLIPLVKAHTKVASKAGIPVMEASNLIQKLNQQKWLKIIKKQSGSVSVTFGARTLLEIPRIRSWLMTRKREVADVPKEEDEEEGDDEEGDDEDEMVELVPDEQPVPTNPQKQTRGRGRRSSRRVRDEEEDDDEMEIEPAHAPWRSKRLRE